MTEKPTDRWIELHGAKWGSSRAPYTFTVRLKIPRYDPDSCQIGQSFAEFVYAKDFAYDLGVALGLSVKRTGPYFEEKH